MEAYQPTSISWDYGIVVFLLAQINPLIVVNIQYGSINDIIINPAN